MLLSWLRVVERGREEVPGGSGVGRGRYENYSMLDFGRAWRHIAALSNKDTQQNKLTCAQLWRRDKEFRLC